MEVGGTLGDPLDKFRQSRVGAQSVDRVIGAGKLGFGKRGVDFVVADLVEPHRWTTFAAAKTGNEVMLALPRMGRDGPVAERADGIAHEDESGMNAGADKWDALVVGGGPAGLAAAEVLAEAGRRVLVAEAMPSLGRKFLMAGKSGLNLTKDEPLDRFLARYSDGSGVFLEAVRAFGPEAVKVWAEGLGQEIFTGSTGRVFPTVMKASPLLRAWLARLDGLGVRFETRMRWVSWDGADWIFDTPSGPRVIAADVAVMALGGASWQRLGSDGGWAALFAEAGVDVAPFKPSNVGLRIAWSDHMAAHFGEPVKAVRLKAGDVESRGECVITPNGIEGGGVYEVSMAVRDGAPMAVDLLSDVSDAGLAMRVAKGRGKASVSNYLRKSLGLSPVARALLMEWGRPLPQGEDLARLVKALPVPVVGPMPMDQAISTGGGVRWDAMDGFMLKNRPGVFVAGEMLDWEAPTGGYLLTGCLATGRAAGEAAAAWRSD